MINEDMLPKNHYEGKVKPLPNFVVTPHDTSLNLQDENYNSKTDNLLCGTLVVLR